MEEGTGSLVRVQSYQDVQEERKAKAQFELDLATGVKEKKKKCKSVIKLKGRLKRFSILY